MPLNFKVLGEVAVYQTKTRHPQLKTPYEGKSATTPRETATPTRATLELLRVQSRQPQKLPNLLQ